METRRQTGQKIENFTEEILIEIFKFLPTDDIENAAKVCKRWHTIITNSTKLVIKPQLIFPFEDRTFENIKKVRKKSKEFPFRCIKFDVNCYSEIWSNRNLSKIKIFKEILMEHKDHIEQLTIAKYEKKFLIDLFNETGINENLTKLELYFVDENGSAPAEDVRFDFPNLKHLSVCMGSKFIDLIRSHQIESLEFHGDVYDLNTSRVGNWKEFLKTCPNLKRLRTFDFFNFDISNFDFKIESFEFFSPDWRMSKEEDIKKFLLAHRETLKDLKMSRASAEIFHVVINELKVEKFRTIQQLKSATGKVLKTNSSIKVAEFWMVESFRQSLEFYEKLINCVTEVEDLSITVADGNILKIVNFIAASMVKLKKLEMKFSYQPLTVIYDSIVKKEMEYLKIEQVESLIVKYLPDDLKEREKLMTCCSNVKNLSIEGDNFKADELRMVIMSHKNLEEISIEGKSELTSEVIDLMVASKIRKITIINESQKLPEKLRKSRIQTVILRPE